MNAQRAAMTPPLPALLLGSTAVADLQTALTNHPGLLQTVENERSELSQKKSQLQTTARRVDRNNKRWYAAWASNFAEGPTAAFHFTESVYQWYNAKSQLRVTTDLLETALPEALR